MSRMTTKLAGRPRTFNHDDLLAILTEPMVTRYWFFLAQEKYNLSRATFFRMISVLRASGKISKTPNSNLWNPPQKLHSDTDSPSPSPSPKTLPDFPTQ